MTHPCPSPTPFLIPLTDFCSPDSTTPQDKEKKTHTFSTDPDSVPLMVNKKLDFCPERLKLCKMLAQIRCGKKNTGGVREGGFFLWKERWPKSGEAGRRVQSSGTENWPYSLSSPCSELQGRFFPFFFCVWSLVEE